MKDAREEAEVTEHTAIDMYQWLREVCSHTLVNGPPIILGGQQTIVQIDESLFRHKHKVSEIIIIIIKLICYQPDSIIVGEQPQGKCGYLGWLTHPIHQLWDIWS